MVLVAQVIYYDHILKKSGQDDQMKETIKWDKDHKQMDGTITGNEPDKFQVARQIQ